MRWRDRAIVAGAALIWVGIIVYVLVEVVPDHPDPEQNESCATETPYSQDSPAYVGPGPHPVVVRHVNDGMQEYVDRDPLHLPEKWEATDFTDAQLYLCVNKVSDGPVSLQCHYVGTGPETVEVREAVYEIVLREAKTGRLVAQLTADGDGPLSCPEVLSVPADQSGGSYIAESISDETLAELLKPYVEVHR